MADHPRDRPRSLTLVDLMVVVAASALWLAVMQAYAARSNLQNIWYLRDYGLPRILQNQVGALLMIASVAMLLVRLRGQRPPRRRLWRQPGLAASAGATAGIAIGLLGAAATWAASMPAGHWDIPRFLYLARPFAAPGVFGAWAALLLTRRWRPEPGAIDRIGRLVGVLWLLEFVIAEMPTTRWIIILDRIIRRGFS